MNSKRSRRRADEAWYVQSNADGRADARNCRYSFPEVQSITYIIKQNARWSHKR